MIGLYVAPDAKTAAMVEVNCETDFVAKNDDFRAFAAEVAQIIARDNPADLAALGARALASGETVEARRTALVQKIGENLSIRRFARKVAAGRLASYVHGSRIGVLVDRHRRAGHAGQGSRDARRREQAGGGVARRRAGRGRREGAQDRRRAGGRIGQAREHRREDGRGRASPSISPRSRCSASRSSRATASRRWASSSRRRAPSVNDFVLFVVGEGIEKKKDDFAAEVAAMTKA